MISISLFVLACLVSIHSAVSDTRYECISSGGGRFGEEYEADETDSARLWTSGRLTCPQADRGSIVVLRVGYGSSLFPGRCESDRYCEEEYDTGDSIADRCDGRASCIVTMMPPRFMRCGRMSDYMMVEYECVDSWKTFDVCEHVSTASRGSSVFITSPGYLSFRTPAATRGTQMCECIIRSQDSADLYLDYLQTQLSNSGESCPYEYVLIESKQSLNQSSIDKQMEICGRRHTGRKWFSGSVRLTYASGGPMRRNGLIAKFTVDNIGNPPNIEVDCGTVNSKGLKLREPPSGLLETQAPSISRTRVPNDPWFDSRSQPPFSPLDPSRSLRDDFERFLSLDDMERDEGSFDDAAERMLSPDRDQFMVPRMDRLPPLLINDLPPRNREPPPRIREPPPRRIAPPMRNRVDSNPPPDFGNWRINIPDTPAPGLTDSPVPSSGIAEMQPVTKPPATAGKTLAVGPTKKQVPQEKTIKPRERLGNGVVRRPIPKKRKIPTNRNGPKKVVDERDPVPNDPTVGKTDTGSYVALVMGGIGAVLIVGSFGIIAFHNYRKRQRIKAKEAEYAISGGSTCSPYGQGWDRTDESVYATIADVDKHRTDCVNPAVSQKLDFSSSDSSTGTFVNQQNVNNDPADDTSLGLTAPNAVVTEGLRSDSTEIAVIEVHQNFEGNIEIEEHNENCLPHIQYSAENQECGNVNACTACSISRPPRRKDASRGYDNNIGVKHKTK